MQNPYPSFISVRFLHRFRIMRRSLQNIDNYTLIKPIVPVSVIKEDEKSEKPVHISDFLELKRL